MHKACYTYYMYIPHKWKGDFAGVSNDKFNYGTWVLVFFFCKTYIFQADAFNAFVYEMVVLVSIWYAENTTMKFEVSFIELQFVFNIWKNIDDVCDMLLKKQIKKKFMVLKRAANRSIQITNNIDVSIIKFPS